MKSQSRVKGVVRFKSEGFAWREGRGGGVSPRLRSASMGESMLMPREHRMSHPFWVIDYCFHAGEEYRVGGARGAWLPRRAQTAHVYPPDTLYWERVVGEPVMRRSAAMLFGVECRTSGEKHPYPNPLAEGEGAGKEMFAGLIMPRHGYAEIEDPSGEMGELMRAAAAVGHVRGEAGFWEAQGVLCRVLDLLVNAVRVSEDGPVFRHEAGGGEPRDLAGRVEAYIRGRLPGRVSLGEIAEAMRMSESALSHGYKGQTGKAVMASAMAMRLELAKPLLLQGQRLKTIAADLGFSDAFHLSKQFKRHMGVSPRGFLGRRGMGKNRV